MREGDKDQYAEVVRRHAPAAHRTAVLFGAGSDADDVVQESFVKAYQALGDYRDGAAFRPWLLRIVVNETKNLHRAARRRTARERLPAALPLDLLPGVGEAADPAELNLGRERQAELYRQVKKLPERYRLVVICRYLIDLDESETATVLGVPRGTVKSRLHRALRELRTGLEAAGEAHGEEVRHGGT